MRRHLVSIAALAALLATPASASAFCGFYVSGADSSLYASATMVVMMRDGTRTVLSMQNSYQGPPEDFAMVVPVPVVLEEANVKTLPREIFDRVDQLAAPRLVEYWEQDPCMLPPPMDMMLPSAVGSAAPRMRAQEGAADHGVTIEAQFQVAEYDIVILSATDSSGLDTWLRQEQYNIPQGAEVVLRPYVEAGTKFFVAKVDAERVTFDDGKAVLSPLRFHYDTPEFSLPVRLGLLNSGGQQDLIVHILGRNQRYEVANYPNVVIPTNIRVVDAVRNEWGSWYDLLFRRTVASNPGAVVTEYSWDASSCDPCPTTPLQPAELMTLGGDVIGGNDGPQSGRPPMPGEVRRIRPPRPGNVHGFVLTRLHYRYGREGLNEDLVFRTAPSIVGGRGTPDAEGNMTEEGSQPGRINNFQGRYVILHRWEGELACDSPQRGRWGGPPDGPARPPIAARNAAMTGSAETTGAPTLTSVGLGSAQDIPVLGIVAGTAEAALPGDPGPPGGTPTPPSEGSAGPIPSTSVIDSGPAASEGGCASCSASSSRSVAAPLLAAAVFVGWFVRRRRRRE